MKILTGLIMMALLGVVGMQVYRLNEERLVLEAKAREIEAKSKVLNQEHEKIEKELKYYSDPHNLAKTMRELFHFKKPGEEVYVIVPKETR